MPRSIKKEFPEIFSDWHPTLNGKVNPSTIRRTSRKKYWWKCHSKKCGCNWKATIYSRIHMGNECPKCIERKKKKFSKDLLEIKKTFKKIKKLQLQADKFFEIFTDDNSTKISKQNGSVAIRRKIDEINALGLIFRKIILNYHKKMIGYNIEKKIKNKKDE
jgi:hypothetical protein